MKIWIILLISISGFSQTIIAPAFYGAYASGTTLATITTSAISPIASISASSGGTIINDGGAPVTQRGICWSTSPSPTTSNSITMDGTGVGVYSSNMTGLSRVTLYYVRAYAVNSVGTSYGNEISFTTLAELPTLTTTAVSLIEFYTATSGGVVSSNGGSAITSEGICWSTTTGPTIGLSTITSDGTTSPFTSNMTGLTLGTNYYVRSYATNSVGTGYGNEILFSSIGVGSFYKGGKVGYIYVSGDNGYSATVPHGLVVPHISGGSLAYGNINDNALWGCQGTNIAGAASTSLNAGDNNTNAIIAACSTPGIAARICNDYTVVVGGITYSDWYLPSKVEIEKLITNRTNTKLAGTYSPLNYYWTSTQDSATEAWQAEFSGNSTVPLVKYGKNDSTYGGYLVTGILYF
jgi:hypothetical protein